MDPGASLVSLVNAGTWLNNSIIPFLHIMLTAAASLRSIRPFEHVAAQLAQGPADGEALLVGVVCPVTWEGVWIVPAGSVPSLA